MKNETVRKLAIAKVHLSMHNAFQNLVVFSLYLGAKNSCKTLFMLAQMSSSVQT